MEKLNSAFLEYMKQKPLLYAKSTSAFWDDEHISEYMLEAHLNPDVEAASRKMEDIQTSVDWIDFYCHGGNGKKLLDLGCGPGIYAELFSEKGFYVTGIDFSKRSIAYAKQHAAENCKDISYFYKNYLEIDYINEFDVITLIYCDFGVLSPKDRAILLQKIWKALKIGGILILDGFTEVSLHTFHETESVQYQENGFWSASPYVLIQRNFFYPETANTLEQYLVVSEEDCACYNIWNQIYSKKMLLEEIGMAGFGELEFFDSVKGEAYSGEGTMICVAAKKG